MRSQARHARGHRGAPRGRREVRLQPRAQEQRRCGSATDSTHHADVQVSGCENWRLGPARCCGDPPAGRPATSTESGLALVVDSGVASSARAMQIRQRRGRACPPGGRGELGSGRSSPCRRTLQDAMAITLADADHIACQASSHQLAQLMDQHRGDPRAVRRSCRAGWPSAMAPAIHVDAQLVEAQRSRTQRDALWLASASLSSARSRCSTARRPGRAQAPRTAGTEAHAQRTRRVDAGDRRADHPRRGGRSGRAPPRRAGLHEARPRRRHR